MLHDDVTALEFLVFLEEEAEADDGAVYQETAGDGHDHGFDLDDA